MCQAEAPCSASTNQHMDEFLYSEHIIVSETRIVSIRRSTCPHGVPQATVTCSLLFLVIFNDLPEVKSQFCLFFVDDTKIEGSSVSREEI